MEEGAAAPAPTTFELTAPPAAPANANLFRIDDREVINVASAAPFSPPFATATALAVVDVLEFGAAAAVADATRGFIIEVVVETLQ